jgi:hypothetical protein
MWRSNKRNNIVMRNRLTLLLLAGASLAIYAGEVTTTYEVTLNGQKFNVNAEATTNVMVEGKELKLSAREKPEKTFSEGNISFAFPAAHTVSKEVEGEVTTWTMGGENNALILLKIKGVDPGEVGKETILSLKKQYGSKSEQSNCRTTFGKETVNGEKITAVLVGETINQEVYELKAGSAGYILTSFPLCVAAVLPL